MKMFLLNKLKKDICYLLCSLHIFSPLPYSFIALPTLAFLGLTILVYIESRAVGFSS